MHGPHVAIFRGVVSSAAGGLLLFLSGRVLPSELVHAAVSSCLYQTQHMTHKLTLFLALPAATHIHTQAAAALANEHNATGFQQQSGMSASSKKRQHSPLAACTAVEAQSATTTSTTASQQSSCDSDDTSIHTPISDKTPRGGQSTVGVPNKRVCEAAIAAAAAQQDCDLLPLCKAAAAKALAPGTPPQAAPLQRKTPALHPGMLMPATSPRPATRPATPTTAAAAKKVSAFSYAVQWDCYHSNPTPDMANYPSDYWRVVPSPFTAMAAQPLAQE